MQFVKAIILVILSTKSLTLLAFPNDMVKAITVYEDLLGEIEPPEPTCRIEVVSQGTLILGHDKTIRTDEKVAINVITNVADVVKVALRPPTEWHNPPNGFQGDFTGSVEWQLRSMDYLGSVGDSTMDRSPAPGNQDIANSDGFNLVHAGTETVDLAVVGYTNYEFTPGYYVLHTVVSCVTQ